MHPRQYINASVTLNRGCAIFREALLLVDETTSSLSIKQFVAYVVAHELAHQWYA